MARELVLDAGALIAAENRRRQFQVIWAEATQVRRIVPVVPTPVVAQYWRSGAGPQALGAKVLRSCHPQPLDFELSKSVGELLGESGTSDIVDATVALVAHRIGADILTSDPSDIQKLVDTLQSSAKVIDI